MNSKEFLEYKLSEPGAAEHIKRIAEMLRTHADVLIDRCENDPPSEVPRTEIYGYVRDIIRADFDSALGQLMARLTDGQSEDDANYALRLLFEVIGAVAGIEVGYALTYPYGREDEASKPELAVNTLEEFLTARQRELGLRSAKSRAAPQWHRKALELARQKTTADTKSLSELARSVREDMSGSAPIQSEQIRRFLRDNALNEPWRTLTG